MQKNDVFTLQNGVTIPCIGFGTWQTPDGETAITAIKEAIKDGYMHIDAAAAYNNEVSVGEGIKASGIKREELFITSKLWNENRGYESTKIAFEKTCKDLDVDYLDLYLIHWPASKNQFENWEQMNLDTWRAMTELYKEGRIKAIGVSNFLKTHLKALMATEVKPMINQIEYHPGCMQEATVLFCKENDILVEAWSPLGSGRVLKDETLQKIAERYNKSVAQICIRWALQNGILPLPKSITPARIAENIAVFDFSLTEQDMKQINEMPDFGESGLHPDKVNF